MKFIINDIELHGKIKAIEKACREEFGRKEFIIYGQIGSATTEAGDNVLIIQINTFSHENINNIREFLTQHKNTDLDNKLTRDFIQAEIEGEF